MSDPASTGWEDRLEALARGREEAAELRERIITTLLAARNLSTTTAQMADALLEGPLVPLLEKVAKVEALLRDADRFTPDDMRGRVSADNLRRALATP